jgi:outer membrane protein assembly factor BamB
MSAENGKISFRELYRSTELQTNMYNTVAIVDDAVFGFAGTKTFGSLQCTDFNDGRLLWKKEGREWSADQNLVVADGLIFAVTKNNDLVLADATREGYRERGRVAVKMEMDMPQQPTIVNGRLYLRGKHEVVCYRIAP